MKPICPCLDVHIFPISSRRRRHQFNSRTLLPTHLPRLVSQCQARGFQRVVEPEGEYEDADEDDRDGGVALHRGLECWSWACW